MAERAEVTALRDAAEAAVTYYSRLGRLTLDLVEAIAPADLRLTRTTDPPAPPPAPEPAAPAPEAESTIVIEAQAGKGGLGVFMVENTTDAKVSGPVTVSAFKGPGGRTAKPDIRFAPEVVTLDPGDQVLVQVAAKVASTLDPGVRYKADIRVPSLSGMRVPLVVRRRPGRTRPTKPAARKKA
jgi:hypothetical protein